MVYTVGMNTLKGAVEQKFTDAPEAYLDYETAAQYISDAVHEIDQERTAVGIFGQGTSGKSFLARLLQKSLAEPTHVICADDFLLHPRQTASVAWSGLLHGNNIKGRPTACDERRTDLVALANAITSFRHGQNIAVPNYLGYARSGLSSDSAARFLIVEGIGASFLDMSLFDLTIFLDISENEELRRRCVRNGQSAEEVNANGFEVRRAQYEANVLPRIPEFDLVFQTDENFRLKRPANYA